MTKGNLAKWAAAWLAHAAAAAANHGINRTSDGRDGQAYQDCTFHIS